MEAAQQLQFNNSSMQVVQSTIGSTNSPTLQLQTSTSLPFTAANPKQLLQPTQQLQPKMYTPATLQLHNSCIQATPPSSILSADSHQPQPILNMPSLSTGANHYQLQLHSNVGLDQQQH